nr:hypothetical protein [uncultured Flavobacterium sp.]
MKKIFFFIIFNFTFFSIYSQINESNFIFKFENDTISVKKNKIIQTSLYIKNNSGEVFTGELDINSTNKDLAFIKKINTNITLNPDEYIYLPFKAQLKPKTISTEIIINAILNNSELKITRKLVIIPEKERNVQIQLKNQHLNFFQVNDSLNLSFNISNNGNTDEIVNLVLKYPNGISKNEFENFEFKLKPYQDTSFIIQREINKQMFKKEDFEIQASLYYKSGDYINSFPIYINSIKQNRTYRDYNEIDYRYNENEIRLSNSYNSTSKHNNFNLGVNTKVNLSDKDQLFFNSQMEYWDSSDLFFLRNTRLEYQNKNTNIKIGNLFQQGEIMLNGVGAEVDYKVSDSIQIEGGIIDKTYSLLEPFKNSNGYSFWSAFNTLKQNKTKSQTFFNYDIDYTNKINKNILFHSQEFVASKNFNLVYQQGLSIMNDNDKMASGILSGITGIYNSNRWSYFGNHIFSSKEYAGSRRGVIQINERFQYKIKNHYFSTFYSYNDVNPESFNRFEYFYNNQKNQNLSLGYRFNHKKINFYLTTNYLNEKRTNSFFNNIDLFKKIGISTTFQYNNFNKKFIFNSTLDAGKILTFNLENPYSYKISIGLKFRKLNLTTQYQYNYSSINDLTNPDQLSQVYQSLNTNLMYSFQAINNRLEFNFFINYSSNNNFLDYLNFSNTINYNLNPNFKIFFNSNYSKYINKSKYSNLNLQFGIIKNFDPNKQKVERRNLTIRVKYNEKNNTSQIAKNRIVFINNKPFITNENGMVTYKKIPIGNYQIRLQNDAEWISEPINIEVSSNTVQEIFYNKTTTISGNISFKEGKNPFEIVKNKDAFRIEVIDSKGKIYKTYTNDAGHFIIYVPEGIYTLSLNNHLSNSQTEVLENNIEVTTEVGKPITQDFIINIKDKKTEVKRFNSVKF